MPLSSRKDMSVSISPWCSWHCAHRGGVEIEGCAVSLSTIAYPQLCNLSHSFSNLWGKGCGTGGGIWACLQGDEGTVDWQRHRPSSHYPPPPTLVPVNGAVVEISKVGWCYPLASHTISLYPSPYRPSRLKPPSRAAYEMLRQHFLWTQQLSSEVLTFLNLQAIF